MRQTDQYGRFGTPPPVPGRPSAFPGSLAVLLAALFTVVTWQVAVGGPLARADERWSRAALAGRLPEGVAELLADLGSVAVAVPVLVLVAAYVAWRARGAGVPRWWRPSVAALVPMAAVPLLVVPLKELIARSGPPVMGPGTGFYPSGHTATATVAYGAATLLLLPWLGGAYARRELTIACCVLNLGVGLGLVRRGYHWPLDVVGSWCLGGLLVLGLWWFLGSTGSTGSTGRGGRGGGPALSDASDSGPGSP
ncbi:phosphatase PAP2 family protein [Streptomyces sp. NPDC058001]|uniref:phosphatase PAP2 family protein n=1 Tax=Streptomyces sp. NPDC058001 TaxID=3346300 RepID=UPI0036EB66C2